MSVPTKIDVVDEFAGETESTIVVKIDEHLKNNDTEQFVELIEKVSRIKSGNKISKYFKNNGQTRAALNGYSIINFANYSHPSFLYSAVEQENVKMVRVLLKHNAKVDVGNLDGSNKETPLYLATSQNNIEIVQLLMQHDGKINEQYGETWLYHAIRNNNVEMCKLLIDVNKQYKHSFDWVCVVYCTVLYPSNYF